jgi:hypothetical protein
MKEVEAKKKIIADFEGAKKFWRVYFDKWSFVHNAERGLPPHVLQLLLEFEKQNVEIKIDQWGFQELIDQFRKLTLDEKQKWFGNAPTDETMLNIGFKDIQVVLETVESKPISNNQTVRDVPPRKIEANALSESTSTLLKNGMVKSSMVKDFFDSWHDPLLGERLAQAFREKYKELQKEYSPNRVFIELQSWVGGQTRGTPEHELSVLTVLAYFFERCDIFEEPEQLP